MKCEKKRTGWMGPIVPACPNRNDGLLRPLAREEKNFAQLRAWVTRINRLREYLVLDTTVSIVWNNGGNTIFVVY